MFFAKRTEATRPRKGPWRDFVFRAIRRGKGDNGGIGGKPLRRLAIRWTLWYAGVTTLSFLVLQVASYLLLRSSLVNRMDVMLREETIEDAVIYETKGLSGVREDFLGETVSVGIEKEFLRVLDAQGHEVAASDLSKWPDLPVNARALQRALAGQTTIHDLAATVAHPSARVIYAPLGPGLALQFGYSRSSDLRLLENYREAYGVAVVVILLCSVVVGWLMARRLLAGVENVTLTAARITRGDLSSRATIMGRGDEIDELAKTFNLMIERIQTLISSMRNITDDIAHDLRSPIMRVRGAAEMALTHATSKEQQEVMVGGIVEECDSLLGLINTMLEISETEAGVARLVAEDFDLSPLVHDMCELFTPASEDKGVSLRRELGPTLVVRGDRAKIRRAVGHVLDNAIKYTEAGGAVTVTSVERGGSVMISVADTGIGIAEKDLTAIFSRFYRADRSRSRPGNGLGLSLSQAIIKAHGGTISVESVPGRGSCFTICLPHGDQGVWAK